MPIDREKIKKALDDFENDDFVSSKEKLKDEIKKAKEEYVKNKTGIEKDLSPHKEEEESGDDENGNEGEDEDEDE